MFFLRFLAAFYRGMKSLSSGFYLNWGMIYARWGQPTKAMYYLSRAAKLNDTNPQIYYQRGLLFMAMGQPASAIADFSFAINSNPRNMEAYLNRSMMLTIVGKHDNAQKDIDTAVELGADRSSLETEIAALREQAG